MKTNLLISLLVIMIIGGVSCKKEDTTPNDDIVTTMPKITSLQADKYEIKVGGEDPAIIECVATGGNLNYKWEVDLGDIFPLNENGSKVRFTGSECCLGEKLISCTVSNDKGEVSEVITIQIYIP